MKAIKTLLAALLLTVASGAHAFDTLACYWLTPNGPISWKLELGAYAESGPTEWPFLLRYRVKTFRDQPSPISGTYSVWVFTLENTTTFKYSPKMNQGCPYEWHDFRWHAVYDLDMTEGGYFYDPAHDSQNVAGAYAGPMNFGGYCPV